MDGFQQLEENELAALLEAPVLITILVGASDGELDREERNWSERLMKTRTYNNPKNLNEFYKLVANDFLGKIDAQLEALPGSVQARNAILVEKLKALNPVLAKLDAHMAADLYRGFLGLAEETAESSGGFLRMGAVSAAENEWVKLPMLTPIHA
jgi:hypothetical protein